MKYLSLGINAALAIAVAVLFYLHFKDCKKSGPTLPTPPASAGTNPIAYVDIDTLEVYYNYYKVKKAELEKNQSNLEASLKAKATRLQSDYMSLQQRAQAGTLTQSEGEAAQTDLQNRGAQLEQERDNSATQIQSEMAALLKEINGRIDTVIRDINKDKKYTYVISYSSATSLILYKDQALDITRPVLEALNAKDEAAKK